MSKKKAVSNIITITLAVLITPLLLLFFFHFVFFERIYWGVLVGGNNLSGLTPAEAEIILSKRQPMDKITLSHNDGQFTLDTADLLLSYDYTISSQEAYALGRKGNYLSRIFDPLSLIFKKISLPYTFSYDSAVLDRFIESVAIDLDKKGEEPSVLLVKGKVVINRGVAGEYVDRKELKDTIIKHLSYQNRDKIVVISKYNDNTLNQQEADILTKRANILLSKRLLLDIDGSTEIITENDLLALINPKGGVSQKNITTLVQQMEQKHNRPPQNPVFVFVPERGVVAEFAQAKEGIRIKSDELISEITNALLRLEESDTKEITIKTNTEKQAPDYQTADVNNLGIKELLGRGTSKYAGSIASRVHNIALATSKFNGILIAPGDTFSFNQKLGDVSQETGYQQAYIIKEGATVLGDGGGVCQVSTTLFRAVLKAGLPIVERRAHAYRVSYYEQDSPPGLDATVYDPSPDFKFKNDTPAHLLIQAQADTKAKTLTFEIYGTSDGRVSATTKPVVGSTVAPPEDLYIDDPTLPAGTIKQIDWKAWGAKVSFTYTVKRNEEIIFEKIFTSNYRPWQAKFLRGTKAVN